MKLINFPDVEPREWDLLADVSQDAWLFSRYDWLLFEKKYFVLENLSFAVEKQGKIIASVPLYKYQLGLGRWSETLVSNGLHRSGGVVFSPFLNKAEISGLHSLIMNEIFERAKKISAHRISMGQQTLCPNILSKSGFQIPFWVTDYGFHLGINFGPNGICPAPFMSTCAADLVVLLTLPEEELFNALDSSCRRALRKAAQGNFSFRKLEGEKGCKDYYDLYQVACLRRNETPQKFEYFQDLFLYFEPKNALMFGVEHEKNLVAAIVLLIDKGSASYLSSASSPEYLDLRVNDYLHWSTILTLKQQGFIAYRLGPYFPTLPKEWPIGKVARFKTKFGATPFLLDQSSYFLSPEKYINDIPFFFQNPTLG